MRDVNKELEDFKRKYKKPADLYKDLDDTLVHVVDLITYISIGISTAKKTLILDEFNKGRNAVKAKIDEYCNDCIDANWKDMLK
jgi:hypothetical protein